MTGRRLARLAVATTGTVLMLGIVSRAQQPAASSSSTPAQTAAEKYKNIQVLKTVPADQLPNAMQYVAASLGVQCGFCHVQGPDGWHFDSDDKAMKGTARKMMRMVDAFNSGNNDITISCATCHHGHQEPERTPPLATEMTPDEAARAASAREARSGGPGAPGGRAGAPAAARGRGPQRPTETADEILGKYLQAVGGASAWSQAKNIVMQGTLKTRALDTTPVKVEQTIAGAYRADMQGTPPMTRAFDGRNAWMARGSDARELEGLQAAQAGRLADFGLAVNAKDRFTGLTAQRYMNLDGTEVVVLVSRAPEAFQQLFFSRESGLLLRRSVGTRTPLGVLPEQIDYSDYREVGGIKVPFQVRYTTWNQVDTFTFTDAKLNAPIDDADFTRK